MFTGLGYFWSTTVLHIYVFLICIYIMITFLMKIIKMWFTWPKPVFCFIQVVGSELANILNASQGLVGIPIHMHLKN